MGLRLRSGTAAPSPRRRGALRHPVELLCLAVLAYLPALASAPGTVSSDSKQYLYLDPSGFLAGAPYLWDPSVAAGTVPHQHIGYLFPMGPWFWAGEALGLPDWVTQRLWWGTIVLAAGLGARALFRSLGAGTGGAAAGALVYMLTPYQLAFTARMSVLLLPWAALPWLVSLARRAVARGGWRDPAAFALVVAVAGGVNASSLLLVLLGPALWLLVDAVRAPGAWRSVLGAAGRMGVLALGVSLWWIVGLRTQGRYGLPVLQLTENVRTVSSASAPNDVLRGLGNWFFYGVDRLGYSLEQAAAYVRDRPVIAASYAVPAAGLVAGALLRWRHRAALVVLVAAGTVVAVGAWPYDAPSPYGRLWRSLAEGWTPALALRNTPRAVPVVVLGVAGLLAGAVGALAPARRRIVAGLLVAAAVAVAFWPVWEHGFTSDSVSRPETIPAYWHDAARALDAGDPATRALEIPGAEFAAYRWGNTVEPVTPGLTDRPVLAREVLPYGSPASVDLLDALDRRIQRGTFEPEALAPVARLFGVGAVLLRGDLEWERFGVPRPALVWEQLHGSSPPGIGPPARFGPPVPADATPPVVDEVALRSAGPLPSPPAVALFPVDDPVPVIRTAPVDGPVVVAGDGDGIVDAAAAGLLDGHATVLELAALDDAALRRALDAGAHLVLTDTNRRRVEAWFSSIRDTKGSTERVGQTLTEPNGYDLRLDPFPDATDDARTVVEQRGGTVDATGDGGAARPEDRAIRAVDGDLRTAWRVGGADPAGERLTVVLDRPAATDHLVLVQPLDGPRDRWITAVDLSIDGGEPVRVDLGPESLQAAGQRVDLPVERWRRLDIEIAATTDPGFDPARANAVGFAEITMGTTLDEVVRLPVDLASRVGPRAAAGHSLDVVMTRERIDPARRGRQDEELALDRRFVLPDSRAFTLSGTVRVAPNAPDHVLDAVLGTATPGSEVRASSHLAGDLGARASRALDGDPGTAWTTAFGSRGQWIELRTPRPLTLDALTLTVRADGHHSVPARVSLQADGGPPVAVDLPPVDDGDRLGATARLSVDLDPFAVRERLRLVIDETRAGAEQVRSFDGLPVAIAEIDLPGPAPARRRGAVADRCRRDLLAVDGAPVAVRVLGTLDDARDGLALEACGGPLDLAAGSHRVRAAAGLDTGLDIDRVVLASGAGGGPAPIAPRGRDRRSAGSTATVTRSERTEIDVSVTTDGEPFWFVLGQSANDGWEVDVDGARVGPRQLVDGYANGWLVEPASAGTLALRLRWTPQRAVWAGIAVSLLAVAACVTILVAGARRAVAAPPAGAQPSLGSPWTLGGSAPTAGRTVLLGALAAAGGVLVAPPWVALLAATAAVVLMRVPRARPVTLAAIPASLVASRVLDEPALAWLALALLAVDAGASWLRRASRAHPPAPAGAGFDGEPGP